MSSATFRDVLKKISAATAKPLGWRRPRRKIVLDVCLIRLRNFSSCVLALPSVWPSHDEIFFRTSLILSILLTTASSQALANDFTMHNSPGSNRSSSPGFRQTEGTFSNLAPNRGDSDEEKRRAEARAGYPNGYYPLPPDRNKSDAEMDREYKNSFVGRTLKDGLERMEHFVVRRAEVREQITHMDQPEIREKYVDLATQTMKDARSLLQQDTWRDEFADGPTVVSFAEALLDFAVSVTPGIGWGRDVYEAITGTDLLSGADMSTSNRGIAIISAATFGAGKIAAKGFVAIEKSMRALSRFIRGSTAKPSLKVAKQTLVSAKKMTESHTGVENFVKSLKDSKHRSVGAAGRHKYKKADYHGKKDTPIKNRAPTNGQDALDSSVQIKESSPRRAGIDYEAGDFVIFDETHPGSGIFHGHARRWSELLPKEQATLRKWFGVNKKGKF